MNWKSPWIISIILIVLIGGVAAGVAGSKRPKLRVYRVALYNLPEKFTPRLVKTNTDVFVYQHVYYPLVQRDEHGRLISHWLDLNSTRAKDDSFSTYRFCLIADSHFSDGSLVDIGALITALKKVHAHRLDMKPLKHIEAQNGCVDVELGSGDPNYFEKLSNLDSTILRSGTEETDLPVGLGPYHVESKTDEKIVLRANPGLVRGDFSQIEFIKAHNDLQDIKEEITDWNHLYNTPIPARYTEGYQKVEQPIWKVYFILVKLPQRKDRLAFAKCFDRARFIKELGLHLIPTMGYLPKGMPGADFDYPAWLKSIPDAVCSSAGDKPVVLYPSYNPNLHDATKSYFRQQDSRLPVHVQVEPRTVDQTIAIAYGNETMINLVGTDAEEPTVPGFLMNFLGQKTLIKENIPGMKAELEAGAAAGTREGRERHFREAHRLLLNSGFVIPLGELVSVQMYPANLAGIEQANTVHGFPQIDGIVIK